jgi:hypothetical protein
MSYHQVVPTFGHLLTGSTVPVAVSLVARPLHQQQELVGQTRRVPKLGLFAQLYDLPSLSLPKLFDFAQERVLALKANQIHRSS